MLTLQEVILRPLQDADAPRLAQLLNNKKIVDNLRDIIPYPYSIADARDFINAHIEQQPVLTFAVTYQFAFCGVIALVPQHDVYRKTAEIGYWLGEPFWGKGIATKSVALVSDYGFELGYARLATGVFEYNTASMKVLEKNGYYKEGVYKKAIFKNGRLWEEHRFAKIARSA